MKGKYDTIVTVDGLVGTTNHHYDVPTRFHVGHVGWLDMQPLPVQLKGSGQYRNPPRGAVVEVSMGDDFRSWC